MFYMRLLMVLAVLSAGMLFGAADPALLKMRPEAVSAENVFRDPDYFNWCSSVIRGKDGRYHLIYSRWKRSLGFDAWLTHSTVAHAVADRPEGPYRYIGTLIDTEAPQYPSGAKITAHNPKIRYFDGRYYLYYISTRSERSLSDDELRQIARIGDTRVPLRGELRRNQRTFVASAPAIEGPWTQSSLPLIEPSGPIETLTVNPAVVCGPDGRYYLIIKGDTPGSKTFRRNQAVAVSDRPDCGFVMCPKPVIDDRDTEDISLWYDGDVRQFCAVYHAHTYIGLVLSENGRDWRFPDGGGKVLLKKEGIRRSDGGPTIHPNRLERPFVYLEKGRAPVLSVAVMERGDAFIVFIPFRPAATDRAQ